MSDEIITEPGWDERNEERCRLIRKKIYGGGLSGDEAARLEVLQAEADRYVSAAMKPQTEYLERLDAGFDFTRRPHERVPGEKR